MSRSWKRACAELSAFVAAWIGHRCKAMQAMVPAERRPELRSRLLICLVAYIVALVLAVFPIPFASTSSLTQIWIDLICLPTRSHNLQELGAMLTQLALS